jgi:hypothetical protein
MSEENDTKPRPEQLARAKRLREEIADVKRGLLREKSPRSFTDRAAAEAARKAKSGNH